jgi:hypothetical protein
MLLFLYHVVQIIEWEHFVPSFHVRKQCRLSRTRSTWGSVRTFIFVSDGRDMFTLNVCPYCIERVNVGCGFEAPVSHVCLTTINQPTVFSGKGWASRCCKILGWSTVNQRNFWWSQSSRPAHSRGSCVCWYGCPFVGFIACSGRSSEPAHEDPS